MSNKMSFFRKIISTVKAPAPVGPYNQAVLADRTLYVSGTLGLGADGKLVSGGAVAQAEQAFINAAEVLAAGGASFDTVVKTTVLLADIGDFAAVNEVYKKVFTKDYPARSTYQVGKLPMGAAVEIEFIALTGDVKTISA